ncbi:hypothetical protein [Legionella parisiensis]|uniref:hypothetical protein n=1 Tax=Legionella parisiensis TaxID=45071 RepID=UPI000731BEA5|nr:hypothetical protein [Legionella parisiensis]KTD40492.1 hypothetical protein Lpar_1809 [Legionella parisiensis]STX77073.1 Uncharacterised protein [Legionella parisiensis]
MNSPIEKDPYEAIVKIEEIVISKITGKNVDALKIHLIDKCDSEHSGASGEIIEIATGKIIYRCYKQTIIDK